MNIHGGIAPPQPPMYYTTLAVSNLAGVLRNRTKVKPQTPYKAGLSYLHSTFSYDNSIKRKFAKHTKQMKRRLIELLYTQGNAETLRNGPGDPTRTGENL